MTGEQLADLIGASLPAVFGILGTALGAWLTHRSASSERSRSERVTAAVAILRLAALLRTDNDDPEVVEPAAEAAATGVITLGFGSAAAIAIIDAVHDWRRFPGGEFPRRKAREELTDALNQILSTALPATRRSPALEWDIASSARRPD